MTLSTIELSGVLMHVSDPLHIGTGYARGLINRTVTRGRDGLVHVPGSALKGKAREACAGLAHLHGLGDCRAPHPQLMTHGDHRQTCLICRVFGAPASPSTLRWHAAHLTQAWQDALQPDSNKQTVFGQTVTRTQVQLSRTRGLAAEAHLFTSELAAEGLTFESAPTLTGRLKLTPMTGEVNVYYELVLLLAGLKLIDSLGGSTSRGAGSCEVTLPPTLRVNGQDVEIDLQLAHIEELQLYWDEAEARL